MIILVIATRNKGKTKEISSLLENFPVAIKNLDDFGPIPDVVEDGLTFEENAYKKASFTARILGYPALADDSGLCVDALGGAPGVLSARYGGPGLSDREKAERLLMEMEGKIDRAARFECAISISMPEGNALTYEASCKGEITTELIGDNGFGYDPVFYYPPFEKTFAQLTMEEKNKVSHRGKALSEVRDEFDKIIKWIGRHSPLSDPSICMAQKK